MFTEQEFVNCFDRLKKFSRKLAKGNYEDLFQDTLEKAWGARARFEPANKDDPEALISWLIIICKNQHYNNLRKLKTCNEAIKFFINHNDPAQIHVVALKECAKLKHFKLPLAQAMGYSYKEIADLTCSSINTKKVQIHRFREHNREAFV